MKIKSLTHSLFVLVLVLAPAVCGQTYITPRMGGGAVANAPMVHIDIFYDYEAYQMRASLDTASGVPHLAALPKGYAFDPAADYAVLSGKPYNYQYGWNLGGLFTPPASSAIWIELIESTPGLECYDGRSDKGTYEPIFGTDHSSSLWPWSGIMVHNTYAVSNAYSHDLFATYRIFFGDALTGSREGYRNYQEATVTLHWTTVPMIDPNALLIGALTTNGPSRLYFPNGDRFQSPSGAMVNLTLNTADPYTGYYSGPLTCTALPATAGWGGPMTNSPSVGSQIALRVLSVHGPAGGRFGVWEPNSQQPLFLDVTGESAGTNQFRVSENEGTPEADPFGQIIGRQLITTKPGLYTVGLCAVDISTNGPSGQSFHQPSEVLLIQLQAGLSITSLRQNGSTLTAYFNGQPGKNIYLEARDRLGLTDSWVVVDGPVAGTNAMMTLTDNESNRSARFYRLRGEAQ